MIREIGSSLDTFKQVRFRPGLNILLTERHELSDETKTRNGSGKSSLILIVHFLLGSSVSKDSLFRTPLISEASFWGRFRLGGMDVFAERHCNEEKRVYLDFGSSAPAGLYLDRDLATGRRYVTVDEWKRWLGHAVFGLPIEVERTPFAKKHAPTFRSMFGYFARRRDDGGFVTPSRYATDQQAGDAQIALSYMLDLDWVLAREFEEERQESRTHKAAKKRAKAAQEDGIDSVAKLRAAAAVTRSKAERLSEQVQGFVVKEQYEETAKEASDAQLELERLSREAAAVESAIAHLESSLLEESGVDGRGLERMYAAAGVQLPGSVLRTFEEVQAFHESVIANRRHHLGDELARQRAGLDEIRKETDTQAKRRTELLRSLDGKGAFKDLAGLQKRLAEAEQAHSRIADRYRDALAIEQADSERKLSRESLLARLQSDFREREKALSAPVLALAEAKDALYADRDGALEIVATESGPQFKVTIEGDRSGGISNMEIFCFDYALFEIVTRRLGGPGFLIHDSHLFDGVDARQVSTAIVLGGGKAEALDAQYIVLLNSDDYAKLSFPNQEAVRKAILPVTLDDTDGGGLFGFRF
jgi:uncharacterized protein YydD (DUF2326 family)